jgi:DNA-binding NarL/FixJ family response regulator
MPGDGIHAAREILANPRLETRVIMLTTFDLDEYLYAAMAAGASGFLLMSSPRAHLLHAVRTATAGDALLDPGLTRRLIDTYVQRSPASSDTSAVTALTEREREVLIELIRGRSNAEIATRLFLAETTVKTHVAAVLRKLGLRDRLQAVIYGYEHGLVRPGDNIP